ncbi:MAG: methylmalonyl-CoA decarboxylase [Elusimicrobiaceae bacterium]|nr:methylmalonyl-CoA decarboxylase [Elusimicrobiaceae bacterium]
MKHITTETKNRTGIITLSNPKKRNALSNEMNTEIADALAGFKTQKLLTVVIRAEKNARVWSAGHDIAELPCNGKDPLAYNTPMEQMLRAIEAYPGVVLAMIQGSVWGGACDMAMTCDIIIADENSSFAITPIKIGLPYNPSGIIHFRNRVGLGFAKDMFFTARPVLAERAYKAGIINHFVPAHEIEEYTFRLTDEINGYSPLAIGIIKEQMRILFRATPVSPDAFEQIDQLRHTVYCSEDYQEGLKAFAEKRKAVFKGK